MIAQESRARAKTSVRLFETRDLRSILRIEKDAFGREAWPAEVFREYARESPQLFLVATVNRKIVGYSIASIGGDAAELASIAVLPQYRGRHVATALLKAEIRKVQRLGATVIRLMVRPTNTAAVSFYRKFGFVRTATVDGYYEDGSAGWRMRLALKRNS